MKKSSIKQIKTSIRKKQIKDGFFDGRFVERAVPDKKKVQDKNKCRLRISFEKE